MTKILIIILIVLALIVGVAWKTQASETGAYEKISAQSAFSMMQERDDLLVIDVRTPQEFAEGHIQGAINVPLQTIQDGDVSALPSKDQTLLVYCRSGNRSATASKALDTMGYSAVYDFGGILSWPYGTVR
ncbi:MAG: rhodanese-like domain-containing protein [Sphaerochaeta sp.]